MANSMKEIKRRIKGVKSTEQITSAMKLVASSKLRRARMSFEKANEYFYFITDSIEEIFVNSHELESMFLLGHREVKATCYVVITSNQGLCGGFNMNVIKEAASSMEESDTESVIAAIGKKGRDFFSKRGYDIRTEFLEAPEKVTFVESQMISKDIIDLYNSGEVDEIVLVYTSFASMLSQEVKTKKLLPMDLSEKRTELKPDKEIEYEPDIMAVFNYLIPKYVEIEIYGAILESATCEYAARRIAMENATSNARDVIAELTLNFNRARQGAITQEITEIIGGSNALE